MSALFYKPPKDAPGVRQRRTAKQRDSDDRYEEEKIHTPNHIWEEHRKQREEGCRICSVWLPLGLVTFSILYFFLSTTYETHRFRLPTPPLLTGALSVNGHLSRPVRMLNHQLTGPESMLVEGDTLYISTADGKVVKSVGGVITATISLREEKKCGSLNAEVRCGYAMGIRRLDNERLVVVDAYGSLVVVNFHDGSKRSVLSPATVVDGKPITFLNDIDVINENEVLVTESSTKWQRRHYNYARFENLPNGRVLRVNLSTGSVSVLVDGIEYPKGIQILPGGKEFLLGSLTTATIYKVSLSTGASSVWAENLPGLPANIRLNDDRETLWVAMDQARFGSSYSLVDILSEWPLFRKFIMMVVPNSLLHSEARRWATPHSLAVKMDLQGKFLSSLHDPRGHHTRSLSEVRESHEVVYLASSTAHFIGRVDMNKL